MPTRQEPPDTGRAVRAAMFVAAATIAHLMAGKAIQNAFFLSTSRGDLALAKITLASGLFSIIFFFLVYRVMARRGPGPLMPRVYGVSALLLLGEWLVLLQYQPLGAILLFLHLNAFSLVLISGFWSLVGERFDPRTAKRQIGRIGGAATFGGLVGGLTSLGVAIQATLDGGLPLTHIVPLLALVHGICAWQVRHLSGGPVDPNSTTPAPPRPAASSELGSGLRRALTTPYLRNLALLVLLVAVSEGLLNYVFMTRAKIQFSGDANELALFFAGYYTSVAFLAFVTQRLLSRPVLHRLGLAWTVACLPLVMALGGLGALLIPRLTAVTGARGMGAIVRDSLYRSGYELLYGPVSTGDKRATKLILDVGVVRLGDVVCGMLVPLITVAFGARGLFGRDVVFSGILVVAVFVAGVAFLLATRFHRGYVHALETNLVARGGDLGSSGDTGLTTRAMLLQTFGGLDLTLAPGIVVPPSIEGPSRPAQHSKTGPRPPDTVDPLLERIAALRSSDLGRVRASLRDTDLEPTLVPYAVSLLAWDEVAVDAIKALRRVAARVTGQLVDALLDPETEFAVRRRLPRVLTAGEPVRAVEGLFAALADTRFEVRYRAGQALTRVQERHPALSYPRQRVLDAVLAEVAVDRRLWEHRRLLDHLEGDDESPFVDQYLRDRANRGLEHVFTVLSLILPREPLTVAFRGLYTDDAQLRGTALEYLETALPEEVRLKLWPFLEDDRKHPAAVRSREEILESLLQSDDTIADRIRQGMKVDRPAEED